MSRPFTGALIALLALATIGCEIGHAGNNLRINVGRQAEELFEWRGQLTDG